MLSRWSGVRGGTFLLSAATRPETSAMVLKTFILRCLSWAYYNCLSQNVIDEKLNFWFSFIDFLSGGREWKLVRSRSWSDNIQRWNRHLVVNSVQSQKESKCPFQPSLTKENGCIKLSKFSHDRSDSYIGGQTLEFCFRTYKSLNIGSGSRIGYIRESRPFFSIYFRKNMITFGPIIHQVKTIVPVGMHINQDAKSGWSRGKRLHFMRPLAPQLHIR